MRFLHTSDWHVGRTIRTRSRHLEFEQVFDELVEIVKDTAPDALLIAGDLYDHNVPTAEAERLVYDVMLRVRDQGCRVVAISGNHESAAKLSAVSRILSEAGITLISDVLRPSMGGIVELLSRDGSEQAEIACVPFIPERRFSDAAKLFEDAAGWPMEYAGRVARLLQGYAAALNPGKVHLLMAHLFASGAKIGGSEREVSVGPQYAVSAQELPVTLSYIALGHIHRAQAVAGALSQTRYSGSLLQLDFGEEGDHKSVTLLEASAGKPARAELIHLSGGRRLRTLTGSLEEVLIAGEDAGSDFLRVVVTLDEHIPGLADMVRERLPEAVQVIPKYPEALIKERPDLARMSLREQFDTFIRHKKGSSENTLLLDAFDEIREEAGFQ